MNDKRKYALIVKGKLGMKTFTRFLNCQTKPKQLELLILLLYRKYKIEEII